MNSIRTRFKSFGSFRTTSRPAQFGRFRWIRCSTDWKLLKCIESISNYLMLLVYKWFKQIRNVPNTLILSQTNSAGLLVVWRDLKLSKQIELIWNYLIMLGYKWFKQIRNLRIHVKSPYSSGLLVVRTDVIKFYSILSLVVCLVSATFELSKHMETQGRSKRLGWSGHGCG